MAWRRASDTNPWARAPLSLALEPRIMFDAAGAATYVDAVEPEPEPTPPPQEAPPATEVAFIDTGVQGWEQIRDAIREDVEIFLIAPEEDGAERMADALQGRSGIQSIHVFSHGFAGGLTLGSASIHAENASTFMASFGSLGAALAPGADILIYGCSVASDGGELIGLIAGFTNADVAGSVDATGAESLGGDWALEKSTGEIEALSPFAPGAVESLSVMLAAPPDQNFDSEAQRFLDAAGETIAGVTYTFVSPAAGTFGITTVPARISITPSTSDLAVMFNYTGGATFAAGALDARFASASGDPFRMVSMEIDTGATLGTSSNLTISGYRNGVLVASDTVDTSVSDSAGSITYAKNAVDAGRGGTVFFNAQWGFVDEISITGVDTIVVLDDLNFDAAVNPNAAPVVDLNGGAAGSDVTRAFVEGGGPVTIAPDALVTDADAGDSITSMVVTLTNAQAGDSLNLDGSFGTIGAGQIAGSGGATITISGTHSRADIQAALRAITFDNAGDDPSVAGRSITVVVNDGTTASETRTATITVTAVNDAPTLTATGASPTFTEGGAAQQLFTAAAVSTIEAGQTVSALTFTVANLADGAAERIVVDGVEFQLVQGAGGALAGGGTASISVAGGVATVTLTGLSRTAAAAQTLVDSIAYRNASDDPTASNPRVATLTSVTDSGGTANGGQDTTALAIASSVTLVGVNDAPTFGEATFALAGTTEDATSGSTSVAAILAGLAFADVDGPSSGLAIVGLAGAGEWQTSADGTNWLAIGPVSGNSARLLDASALIRYVPDGANGETATLTVRAWDGSAGAAGDLVDATTNGGATPYSATTASVTIAVSDVNDAPAITDGATYVFAGTDENTPGAAVTVATILADVGYADVDAGALTGLALSATTGPGAWQYSTDGGANWIAVGAVDADGALLLRGADQIRFATNDVGGGTGTLSFRAWDQTSGAAGDKVAIGATGGTTAFSAGTATASITVADVNDAPTFGEASFALAGTTEDATSGSTSVAAILAGLAFADVDGPSSGLAVVGLAGAGEWQTSTDGTNWLAIGPVSGNSARLLDASALIRYVPDGANGETATLTVRAWDGSAGAAGDLVDATTNGGTTPYSATTASVTIAVSDVNDAPTVSAPANLAAVEDVALALAGISFADVDAGSGAVIATFASDRGTLAATSGGGVVVTGSGTGGVTLTGSIADINAFVAGGSLTYLTAPNDVSAATLTVTIDDGGATGGDPLQASTTIAVTITPVNDAPVIGGVDGETSGVVSGAGPQAVALFADATVSDVDSAAFDGGRLTIEQTSGTANGSFGLGAGVTSGGNPSFADDDAVSVGGVVIGSVLAGRDGQNGAALEIALNADATPERVQTLLRALTYDAPSGLGERGFALAIDDGGASGGPNDDLSSATVSFTIAATPNPPVVTGIDGETLNYREGDGLVRIDADQNAAATDADSANFAGGELRVAITAGGVAAEDRLSFAQVVGEVEIDGADLRVGGVVIGALAGGAGGADLVVTLNSDATPARISTLLRALAYENLDNAAPTESVRTVSVTIRDAAAGPTAATSLASVFTVAVEGVNDAPTLTGVDPAAQAIDDTQTIAPFAAAVVADPDGPDAPLTVTVTIDDAAKGSFTTLAGFAHQGGGTYVFSGNPSEAQAALRGLVFTPAENRLAPGQSETTSFTIVIDDGEDAANATAQVQTTSVNDAPTLGGLALGQATTDAATIAPFTAATIADPDVGQTITVSVSLDDAAKGAFTQASLTASGFADQGGGVYALSASSAADARASLRALVYAPTANRLAVGASETTTFTISVSDGVAAAAVGAASVEATSINDAPTVGGIPAQQQTGQNAGVAPFANAVVVDPDPGQPAEVTVTIDDPSAGAFSPASLVASGFAAQGGGVFTFSGIDAADAQAALRALVFEPAAGRLAAGVSGVATFTVEVFDGLAQGATSASLTILGPPAAQPAETPPPPVVVQPPDPPPSPPAGGPDAGGPPPPPPLIFTPTPPPIQTAAGPDIFSPPGSNFGSWTIGAGPSFFVSVADAGAPVGFGVMAQTPIAPIVLRGETSISFKLPVSTFVVESAGLRLLVGARLADGSPLPAWVEFDPATGTFKVNAPPGFTGELSILIEAGLPTGQTAVAPLTVTIEPEEQDVEEQDVEEQPQQRSGSRDDGAERTAEAPGKRPLTEALKAAGRGALATQTETMLNLLIVDLHQSDREEHRQLKSENA